MRHRRAMGLRALSQRRRWVARAACPPVLAAIDEHWLTSSQWHPANRQGQSTRSARWGALALGLAAALAAGGCAGPMVRSEPAASVLSAPQLVAAHNAWADSIAHVWSRARLTLNFPKGDDAQKRETYDLDGHVFWVKPASPAGGPEALYVHGQVMGQEVFAVGAGAERFWLWIRPQVNMVWTGRRGGAGERRLVLSPSDLAAALGMERIDLGPDDRADLRAYPDQYVLSRESRGADGRRTMRRFWFDRTTLRPIRIDLSDLPAVASAKAGAAGRRILMAELLKYQRIGRTEVCVAYRVRFYGEGGEEVDLVLRLDGVRLDKKPSPKIFEYRLPPGAKEENLDAGNL